MSDVYSTIFSDDPRTGALTAAQLQARRQIAIALATRNRPYPKTIGEGLTALGEGLGEGYFNTQVARAEGAQTAGDAAALRPPSGAVPPPAPSVAPAVPRAPAGRTSMDGDTGDTATQALAYAAPSDATETTQPLTTAQASQQPQMSIDEWLQRAARNETGAEKDPYNAVGPVSRRGDHAYGKYQVMGENIPVWTKKYLGEEMTPQEFLADKDAQDQVARGKGGEYLAKYGPTGAAAAWFAGENGMNDPNRKDTLGTHVAEYQRRFNIPLVSRDQVVGVCRRKSECCSAQRAAIGLSRLHPLAACRHRIRQHQTRHRMRQPVQFAMPWPRNCWRRMEYSRRSRSRKLRRQRRKCRCLRRVLGRRCLPSLPTARSPSRRSRRRT